MRVTIICSDVSHPVNAYLKDWATRHEKDHEIALIRDKNGLAGGDLLFLVSCNEIIGAAERAKYRGTLVLHASDLPTGRGWSPHIWELAAGASHFTLSLLEAEDSVDSGRIWKKLCIPVPRTALWDEINHLLFTAELQLMDFAIESLGKLLPQEQDADGDKTYYPRRTTEDSRIDANKSIAEQFDLIRVCDPNRFPAYFEHLGQWFSLKLERLNDQ